MKIWHISDTHAHHHMLTIPDNIDMVIHSGDFTNYYDIYKNQVEAKDFLDWYGNLPIKYKVLICGNHDAVGERAIDYLIEKCDYFNIHYLHHTYTEIEDIKIFGSPYTPTFGDWYFNKNRNKLDKYWSKVDEDVDIFICHGPPKGILDLSYDYTHKLKYCGDKALFNHITQRIKPKFMLFGHIHNNKDIINAGILKPSAYDTIFSNGSVVTDGKFGSLSSNGNILNYE